MAPTGLALASSLPSWGPISQMLMILDFRHFIRLFLGMCLLTIRVSVPSLRPSPLQTTGAAKCRPVSRVQVSVFFAALYILALGTGGTKPNISTIGADQLDEFDPKERAHKISVFNWWMFSVFLGTLFMNIILVYVQDNLGWSLGYGLPTSGLAISLVIFFAGTPFYRHKVPQGSPFTRTARVLVALLRKWRVPLPKDPSELHEFDLDTEREGKLMIPPHKFFEVPEQSCSETWRRHYGWMLCPVTQVEEASKCYDHFQSCSQCSFLLR